MKINRNIFDLPLNFKPPECIYIVEGDVCLN
jgi:hypothetical protein